MNNENSPESFTTEELIARLKDVLQQLLSQPKATIGGKATLVVEATVTAPSQVISLVGIPSEEAFGSVTLQVIPLDDLKKLLGSKKGVDFINILMLLIVLFQAYNGYVTGLDTKEFENRVLKDFEEFLRMNSERSLPKAHSTTHPKAGSLPKKTQPERKSTKTQRGNV